jgi:hypothetical protein
MSEQQIGSASRFSPRASLAAIGLKLQELKLFERIRDGVHVPQKKVKFTPAEKLYDAFITILAGARGLNESEARLRSDEALQRAFGRSGCAESSVIQDTLDACTPQNVTELKQVVATLFQQHSLAICHDYSAALQLLDIDMSGLPCGPKAELSTKGYFSKDGIRYGRQLGRVIASSYEEIVVDDVFAGHVQLNVALRSLVIAAEEVLQLDFAHRQRTLIRMDSGGGSLSDVNWLLDLGYQLHCKDYSSQRAEVWASTVVEWFSDPDHKDRELGWVVPLDTPDYVRPVKRLAIRWRKRNGQMAHDLLISTLGPQVVMELLGQPESNIYEPELVALAYAQLYDLRAGTIEIELKEDKQGVGLTKRRKKRATAQQMIVLLNTLAHNVLMWARGWLSAAEPKAKRYGILRLVRDVCSVSGMIETNERGQIRGVFFNRGSTLARRLVGAFKAMLQAQGIAVELASI